MTKDVASNDIGDSILGFVLFGLQQDIGATKEIHGGHKQVRDDFTPTQAHRGQDAGVAKQEIDSGELLKDPVVEGEDRGDTANIDEFETQIRLMPGLLCVCLWILGGRGGGGEF